MEESGSNPFDGLKKEVLLDQLTRYIHAEQVAKKATLRAVEETESWTRRLQAAKESQNEHLLEEAHKQKDQALAQVIKMKSELEQLEREVSLTKDQIKAALVKSSARVSGTDPQQLLASLEAMSGKTTQESKLDRELKTTEADSLLARFKEQLKHEGKL